MENNRVEDRIEFVHFPSFGDGKSWSQFDGSLSFDVFSKLL